MFIIFYYNLTSDTTFPNGNTLEWILWRKWDGWSWTSMTNSPLHLLRDFPTKIKLNSRYHFHLLIPTIKQPYRFLQKAYHFFSCLHHELNFYRYYVLIEILFVFMLVSGGYPSLWMVQSVKSISVLNIVVCHLREREIIRFSIH